MKAIVRARRAAGVKRARPTTGAVLGGSRVTARIAACIAAFICASTQARADGAPSAEPARAPDEEPTEVEVRGTQSSGFVGRASEGTAPREITDAASLVEPLPGVHVRRYGADDAFATLSIRGSTSNEVAIVLAGVPLTGGADPSLDLASLPLWPGAEARVYRSFAPAALGPGSLGGTLALDPPAARGPARTEVWSALGSFGAARMRVGDVRSIGGDDDGARLATALSASRADDAFAYVDPLASTPEHDVTKRRENSAHAAVNGLVSLALPTHFQASPGSFTVTALAQARHQELPGTVRLPTPHQVLDSNRLLASMELAGAAGPGAWTARLWGRRDGLTLRDDPRQASSLRTPHDEDAIVAVGGALGWRGDVHERVRLEARADTSAERFAPGAYIASPAPPGALRVAAGAGVDAEARPTEAWTLAASGRLDAWNDTAAASADAPAASLGDVQPTAHVGSELRAGALTFAAHGGRLARAPSFVERFGDRGAFVGDPSLRPEHAWTFDAGARTQRSEGAVRLRAELVGFASWAGDLIVFVAQGAYGRARATNIGRARLLGAEAEIGAGAYGVDVRASYTGLATANLSDCRADAAEPGVCERPPLPGRPTHDLVTDVSYTLGPLRLRYGIDVVSGIAADLTGTIVVPPRVLQSVGARLDVPGADGLRIALDLRNLFDVRTATYDGVLGPVREPIGDQYLYPLPGRSFLLSARFAPR